MAESLIIHLRNGASPQWLVCNSGGEIIVNPMSGTLPQAVTMSAGRRVVAIVPAGEVVTTDSDAPAKGAARLAQVVPYALEERVADEIENLHFAIGERGENGRVPVSVVARRRVDEWLAELRAAGLAPQAIYPEQALVPAMPGQLIVLIDGETTILRTADAPPVVMPTLSLADAFELVLATQRSPVAGLEPAPLGCLLYADQEAWEAHGDAVDAFRDRFTNLKVQLLPAGPITVLAAAAAAGEAVNLLQGSLAVASPLEQGWRAWRIAAGLAAALLLLHVGWRGYELTRLHKSEAALDASIDDAFRAAMPGQQNTTNARRRVAARLAEVRGGGGHGTLLPALAAIASARSAAPTTTIEGITFREGTLNLILNAPDAASLDAIGKQLRAASWQADIVGGSLSGESYRGSLRVRKGGA